MDDEDLENLREILAIQGADGNWNYDPYMHGCYNGMELMLAYIEDRDPIFKDEPDEWIAEMTIKPARLEQ